MIATVVSDRVAEVEVEGRVLQVTYAALTAAEQRYYGEDTCDATVPVRGRWVGGGVGVLRMGGDEITGILSRMRDAGTRVAS